MNAIKNALVTTTLVAVGYGVYVILASPSPAPPNSAAPPSPAWGIVEGHVPATAASPLSDNSWQEIQPPQLSVQMESPKTEVAVSRSALVPAPFPVPAPLTNSVPTAEPTLPSVAENPPNLTNGVSDPYLNAQRTALAERTTTTDSQVQSKLADAPVSLEGGNFASLAAPSAALAEPSPVVPATVAVPAESLASGSPFDSAWQTAQRQLQQGKIADSLFTLSIWYQDLRFTEEQRVQCLKLLDELAADVIYSREHHLQPAYIVRSGETMETIATQFQVPSQFLARVNGIEPPFQLVDGESIKVVQGPFRAEIDIRRREMTLFVGSYYAGRVPIELGQDATVTAGEFEIVNATIDPPYEHPESREQIAGADPRNPYGRFWLGLTAPEGQKWGIHGSPAGVSGDDTRGSIRLSSHDVDNVQAILSLGSAVIIR
ncbi:MAG: LysM peptidoglycan-binding domain-containing protein [Planctomycetota bacterium]|nr:LysM peptidoglycan-binding domain-containing protein [Planctomycetota bacterium]MDA1178745.1 LysM peptidoglycan-binding domain-containing protein [Planctomycetota bacterium]